MVKHSWLVKSVKTVKTFPTNFYKTQHTCVYGEFLIVILYVTIQAKTSLVHTSNFATLEIRNFC